VSADICKFFGPFSSFEIVSLFPIGQLKLTEGPKKRLEGGEWESIKNSRKQKFGQDPDLKPKPSLLKDA